MSLDGGAKCQAASVQKIRVSDFVNYTHILIELSGRPGSVEFHTLMVGDRPVLSVKLYGVQSGSLSSSEPVDSYEILGNISVSSTPSALTLTIPCRESVDLANLVWHPWNDMVTIDLPLSVPNHSRIPSIEELTSFREKEEGRIVIVDAGHGGDDSGASPLYVKSPNMIEKDVTLALSNSLTRKLNGHPKIKAFMTRYGDYLPVPFGLKGNTRAEYKNEALRYRVQLAKEYLGNVYISLHLNAPPSRSRSAHQRSRGFEIYYLGEQHAENLIQNPDVVELTSLGIDDQAVMDDKLMKVLIGVNKDNIPQSSMDLAGLITSEVRRIPWMEIRDPAMKSNRFTVIRQLLMPSVLVECMFITNPTEYEIVRNGSNRERFTDALYNAVRRLFFEPATPIEIASAGNERKPSPQTAPPPQLIETSESQLHTVQRDENLAAIAEEYGVSLDNLRNLNKDKIGRGDSIQAGESLRVSGETGEAALPSTPEPPIRDIEMYTVRKKDTLSKIARQTGVTVDVIKSLNNYHTANPIINPGDQIKVPAKRKEMASASVTPSHYSVKVGDTLSKIAQNFGTTVNQLKRLNGYKAKNPRLDPGDRVRIR